MSEWLSMSAMQFAYQTRVLQISNLQEGRRSFFATIGTLSFQTETRRSKPAYDFACLSLAGFKQASGES